MKHVDDLSRTPVEKADEYLNSASICNTMVREDEIMMCQCTDELLARKIDILQKSEELRTRRQKGEVQEYVLRDGILFKICSNNEDKEFSVIARAMRKAIVIINMTCQVISMLKDQWLELKKTTIFPKCVVIFRHIAAFLECLFAKHKTGKQPGELHAITPAKRPFAIVYLDHLGTFVTSSWGNIYYMYIVHWYIVYWQQFVTWQNSRKCVLLRTLGQIQ